MNEYILNNLGTQIYNWLTRKTANSAVRKIGELPLVIGSDIGVVRGENQDRVAVLRMQFRSGHSFLIAALSDGMGGMTEGSACASKAIVSFFMTCIRKRYLKLAQRVVCAVQDANNDVHALYKGRGGATLSAILIDSAMGILGVNVGDSRIYAYQGRNLDQITVDDTMAGLLKNGHQNSNELLQYIGMGEGIQPHVINIPSSNELLFLTSDGVHFLEKYVLQSIVYNAKDSALAVKRLIDVAKWFGGPDNASIAVIKAFNAQLPLIYNQSTLQIWDPFGDLQIMIAESAGIGHVDHKLPEDRKPNIRDMSHKSKQSTKAVKKDKPIKQKVIGKVVLRKKDEKEKEKQPQLNIYFSVDNSKDNHE